jgi:hypothetical protein
MADDFLPESLLPINLQKLVLDTEWLMEHMASRGGLVVSSSTSASASLHNSPFLTEQVQNSCEALIEAAVILSGILSISNVQGPVGKVGAIADASKEPPAKTGQYES